MSICIKNNLDLNLQFHKNQVKLQFSVLVIYKVAKQQKTFQYDYDYEIKRFWRKQQQN